MRKLDTSAITPSVGMKHKGGVFVHLQAAYQEVITALANTMLGGKADAVNYFVLFGCVNTGSGLNYNISAGAIYFNGEVFLVDAAVFTAAGGQVAVGKFITGYFTGTSGDPMDFTDSVPRNVLQIRKLAWSADTAGAGAIDFSALRQTTLTLQNILLADLGAAFSASFEQNKSIYCQAATVNCTISFDFTNAVPGTVLRLKWTFGAGKTLTINAAAGQTIIRDSGSLGAVASANNLIYFIYLGKNELGNDEVSYNIKQY